MSKSRLPFIFFLSCLSLVFFVLIAGCPESLPQNTHGPVPSPTVEQSDEPASDERLAILPDGKWLVSGSLDGTVKKWDLTK